MPKRKKDKNVPMFFDNKELNFSSQATLLEQDESLDDNVKLVDSDIENNNGIFK